MANKDTAIYVANTTGFVELPGGEEFFFFRQGVTKVRADHPVMKACPRNFEPLDASVGGVGYIKP